MLALVASALLWAGFEPVGMDAVHMAVWLSAAFTLMQRSNPIPGPGVRRLMLPWLVFSAWLGFVWLLHGTPDAGRDVLLFALDGILASWIVSGYRRRDTVLTMIILLGTGALLAGHQILLIIRTPDTLRLPGIFAHGYHFGFMAVILFFPALGIGLSRSRRAVRYVSLSFSAIFLIYLFLDVKTLPLLVFVPGLIYLMYRVIKDHRQKRLLPVIGAAGAAILILSSVLLPNWLLKDIKIYFSHHVTSSLTYHLPPMITAWATGWAQPLTGAGPGSFPVVSAMHQPPGMDAHVYHAHSGFLELFAEAGIPGVVLVCIGIISMLRFLSRYRKQRFLPEYASLGILISLIAAIVMGCLDFGLQTPANLMALIVLLSIGTTTTETPSSQPIHRGFRYCAAGILLLIMLAYIPHTIAAVYLARAKLTVEKGRYVAAAASIESALNYSDDDRILERGADIYLALTTLRGSEHDFSRARTLVDRVIEKQPLTGRFYASRAALRRYRDEHDPGIDGDLQQAYKLSPSNIDVRIGYMEYLVVTGDLDGFRQFIESTLPILSPVHMEAFSGALVALTNTDERVFNVLLPHISQMPPPVIKYLASILNTANKYNKLEILYHTLPDASIRGYDGSILLNLLKTARDAGLTDPCRRLIPALQQREKTLTKAQQAEFYHLLGDMARAAGAFHQAEEYYAVALHYAPDDLWIHKALADLIRAQDGDQAEIDYWLSVKVYLPASYRMYLALGSAYERTGRTDLALANYRQAEALAEGSGSAHIQRLRHRLGVSHFPDPMH